MICLRCKVKKKIYHKKIFSSSFQFLTLFRMYNTTTQNIKISHSLNQFILHFKHFSRHLFALSCRHLPIFYFIKLAFEDILTSKWNKNKLKFMQIPNNKNMCQKLYHTDWLLTNIFNKFNNIDFFLLMFSFLMSIKCYFHSTFPSFCTYRSKWGNKNNVVVYVNLHVGYGVYLCGKSKKKT